MTSHEVYVALFWIVAGSYIFYLGWLVYVSVAERAARLRHPSNRQPSARASSSRSTSARSRPRSASRTNM